MGCDIHIYLEHAGEGMLGEKRHWKSVGGKINPGRDYDLFAKIAGVREYGDEPSKRLFEVRGCPDDLGWQSQDDNRMRVVPDGDESEDREVSRSRAEEWIKYGSHWIALDEKRPEYWVSDPDNHSHTWLSPAEFRTVLEAPRQDGWNIDEEYWAILAAAEELEKRGRDARFVIWFDN